MPAKNPAREATRGVAPAERRASYLLRRGSRAPPLSSRGVVGRSRRRGYRKRNREALSAELGRLRLVAGAGEELHPEPRAADALSREGDRRRVEMASRRVDVRGVSQAELDVDR